MQRFAKVIGGLRPVTIKDLVWLRGLWQGPLVVKGVLRHEELDEMLAVGVDGFVVSNHGGRNLDTTPATIDVLPEVVTHVDGRAEVYIDGGIRRGTDIVKAIALGASAVLVGRPYLHGLAARGEKGVTRAVEILRNEMTYAMTFVGAAAIDDIDPSMVRPGFAVTAATTER